MVIFQGNTELYYNHTPNVYDDKDSRKTCISTRINNNGCTKSTWSHSVDIQYTSEVEGKQVLKSLYSGNEKCVLALQVMQLC